jgi:hypothetical protein
MSAGGERRRAPLDRRHLLPRKGGRREADAAPDHGTYARYKRGCRCVACRAANAAQSCAQRADARHGKKRLAQRVSAVDAQRLIRLMRREGYQGPQLAAVLGLRPQELRRLMRQRTITVATEITVQLFYEAFVADPADTETDGASSAAHGPQNS